MILLTDYEDIIYELQEECHICQKDFCYNENEENKSKIYRRSMLEIIVIIQENLEERLMAFAI